MTVLQCFYIIGFLPWFLYRLFGGFEIRRGLEKIVETRTNIEKSRECRATFHFSVRTGLE